jgi:hypothetical protein
MKKRIHVNQHAIKRNRKHGTTEPVITVKTYKSNELIYSPDKPLSCGAHVWIETDAEVVAIEFDVDE